MEPVRVKLYGLFPTSKGRYIAQIVIACVLMAVMLGTYLFHWQGIRSDLNDLRTDSPLLHLVVGFCDSIPYIVLGFAVLQTIEAYYVFRAFARKQAEQTQTTPTRPGTTTGEPGSPVSPL